MNDGRKCEERKTDIKTKKGKEEGGKKIWKRRRTEMIVKTEERKERGKKINKEELRGEKEGSEEKEKQGKKITDKWRGEKRV